MSTWKTRDWNWSKVSVRRPRLVCSGRSSAPSATRHVSSSSADSSSPPSNGGSSVLTARAKLVHFRTWAPELVGRDPDGGHDPPGFFFFSCRVREPRTDDGQTLAGGHTATRVGRQRYEIGDVGSVVSGVEQVIIDAVIGASRNPCRLHFQMEFVRVSGQISKLRKIVVLFPLQRTGTVFRKKMAINQSGLGVSRLSLGSRDLRGSWSFLRM